METPIKKTSQQIADELDNNALQAAHNRYLMEKAQTFSLVSQKNYEDWAKDEIRKAAQEHIKANLKGISWNELDSILKTTLRETVTAMKDDIEKRANDYINKHLNEFIDIKMKQTLDQLLQETRRRVLGR